MIEIAGFVKANFTDIKPSIFGGIEFENAESRYFIDIFGKNYIIYMRVNNHMVTIFNNKSLPWVLDFLKLLKEE